MSLIGKNIKKIRGIKSLSQQAFAELFGLKRATLGAYEEQRSEPKIDTIIQIAKHFNIPIDDLLTKELTVNALLKFKGELTMNTGSLKQNELVNVPFVNKDSIVQYATSFQDKDFIKELPRLTLPIQSKEQYRAFEVQNLEMSNDVHGLFPKDVVIGQHLGSELPIDTKKSILAALVIDEKVKIRNVYFSSSKVELKAEHPGISDEVIDFCDIKELWEIKFVYYNRVPNLTSVSVEDRLKEIEEKLKLSK